MASTNRLATLSDDGLLAELGELVTEDNERTAELLRYIDEVDRRHLWAKRAHPSLFDFLVKRFHMSEAVAYRRIRAARTARRFPLLFDMVARGEMHLSGIHRLSSHLTPENHREVLAEATHMTIEQIERLVARLAPQPDVPSRIRALPPLVPGPGEVAPPPRRAPDPEPLAPRRYKLAVTMSEASRATLARLQALLAHRIPDGDPARIVALGLDVLLEQTLKEKAAVTDRPRPAGSTSSRTRSIPAHVKREVWERDEGRCSFVGEDGRRCNETRRLEYGHREPWAKGGEHTVANLALRCHAHNAYEAVRDYGPLFMAHKIEVARSVRDGFGVYGARVQSWTGCG